MNRSLVYSLVLAAAWTSGVGPFSFFRAISLQAAQDNYLLGCGSADITGPAAGFSMQGFFRKDQLTEGIHLRQRARAFLIAQLNEEPNEKPDRGKRIVFVCADLCLITPEIHRKVLVRLQQRFDDLYTEENVILSATHTHSGAGGYWRYGADGSLGAGFFPEYVDAIVAGIESAIAAAHQQLRPGRILVARGNVQGAGANRSVVAYRNNPKAERALYLNDTDTEMTLLKFLGGKSGDQALGTVNWFAVHPTSMTYNNHFLSSDSKGYASIQFERQMGAMHGAPNRFVAAFAQSNCGDVTGNLNLNNTGPGKDEFQSTQIIGQRQLDVARRLYEEANEALAGPIDVRHTYVDFSRLAIAAEFTKSGPQTTSPAAYGYSFAAGSTEDGGGHPLFQEGMKERNPAIDLLAYQMFPDFRPNERIRQLQQPKAVLFAPGAAKKDSGLAQVLPLSVCRIGQLAIVVGPAEFTTMAGRRVRRSVQKVLGNEAKYVVIAGYSNAYSGYVSTREEYEMQQYEGGHTLFGPWTLAGYQQEYVRLARAMVEGKPVDPGPKPVGDPIPVKLRAISFGPDIAPTGAAFGDIVVPPDSSYTQGQCVEATFWTGHPRNSFHTGGNYLSVQRQLDGQWTTLYTDADWETRCRWQPSRNASKPCRILITWDIPLEIDQGVYRIVHHGRARTEADESSQQFEGATDSFRIE